jgi:exodeoxyribonuclease V gamma subunit
VALHLHRASRTDELAHGLGELLARPLMDPFDQDVVVVPARGVERWLTQRLSHRLGIGSRGEDGVCAGVRFLSPSSLIALLLDREDDDPWAPDHLVWPLLGVIDDCLDESWNAALARHLGHRDSGEDAETRRGRRWSVARRLAGLFASYAVQRPDLIAAWSRGDDTDGVGQPLDDDLLWQPQLWRRLTTVVDSSAPHVRHAETLARLVAGDPSLDLPARLSLFGHTRIPVTEAQLLAALARVREVHLWLPQASPELWTELVKSGPTQSGPTQSGPTQSGPTQSGSVQTGGPLPGIGDRGVGAIRRADDGSAERARHPLLASLGRDARELARTIGPWVDEDDPTPGQEPSVVPSTGSLLSWLQADITANRRPGREVVTERVLDPSDRSIQVHACHGPHRQIDVLREVLVGLLEDDSTLEPRDIVVMCPDIETFAPLIQAGFGQGEFGRGEVSRGEAKQAHDDGHPAHRLRVSLADRSLAATNPLLAVATHLVALAGGRVTATDVLDLLGVDVVRRRFGLDDDDLSRIAGWVDAAGVRWGLDASHRAAFAMDRFGHNTWRAGMDRILVGVAMSADEFGHVGPALALDDVGSNDIELAGQLGEFLDRLHRCLNELQAAFGVATWLAALGDGVRALTDVPREDQWQVAQFEREFSRACTAATRLSAPDQAEPGLRLADVRAVLGSLVVARPTRANFRTGTLSVCTLVPMRSVPHRVVCLVGLDDGLFPRAKSVDGDDVLARSPMTGERDQRSEDRQLLLDAIMSARDGLVICYTGADEHTGAIRPPAVPVDEILDAVSRTTSADPLSARDHVLTRHPLQPHDARNFRPDGIRPSPYAFSFDHSAVAGGRAGAGERRPVPAFLPTPLPPMFARSSGRADPHRADPHRADLNLADLKAFLAHPVRGFLRHRLQVGVPLERDVLLNSIPVELDALEKWDIGDRLLREVVAGRDPVGLMTAEQLRGTLPPGQLGDADFRRITADVQALVDQTAPLRVGSSRAIDVSIDLGGGRLLTGTVSGVYGSRIVSVGYSSLRAKQRLMSWLDLVALSAGFPDQSWTAHAVGKARGGPTRALAGPLDERAKAWLIDLVELYDEGQCAPLPAPVKTACAWAEGTVQAQLGGDRTPRESAATAWETDPNSALGIPGEDADAYHRRVFGEGASIDVLLRAGLADAAWRIWQPLLTGAEKVGPL